MTRKYGAQEDQAKQPENTGDTFGNLCTKKHTKKCKNEDDSCTHNRETSVKTGGRMWSDI